MTKLKGLIAGGGHGTRLRPITHTRNKHLIKIANKPLIFYAIENLIDVGIDDIAIVCREDDHIIREVVGNGSRWGIKITYLPQSKPEGLAQVVQLSRQFMGKSRFVFHLGDNLLRRGVSEYVDKFEELKSNCHILITPVDNPQAFGVPTFHSRDKDRIIRLTEKPKRPDSNFAMTGIYCFDENIFEAIETLKRGKRGEYEITDAITKLIEQGFKVTHSKTNGWWKDTGKPADMLEANSLILREIEEKIDGTVDKNSQIIGGVVIEKGAKIIRSTINGPVVIGGGSVVENSFIGPFTSISSNCRIKNSEIEMSIVGDDTELTDLPRRVRESIIGERVSIKGNQSRPRGDYFIIGDQSTVSVC